MPQSYTCLLYHVVFSTKDREPWLHAELRPRLWEYLSGAIRSPLSPRQWRLRPCSSSGSPPPGQGCVRRSTANSSGWIHDAFSKLRGFHWQDGYGAFTVSKSQTEAVRRYIANQEAHHHKIT